MTCAAPPVPAVLDQVAAAVAAGRDAVLSGAGAAGLLDQAVALLARQGVRVLRASAAAPGGLGLSGLMAQVAGRPDLSAQDDATLARSHQVLTTPGEGFGRVALLVDGAETMPLATLRCLQLVCRSRPDPVLVFAGVPMLLGGAELAGLRARLLARPVLDVPMPKAPIPDAPALGAPVLDTATPVPPPAVAAPRRRGLGWAGAVAGMAASALVGVWVGRQSVAASPPAATELMPATMPPALPDVPPPPDVSEAAAQPLTLPSPPPAVPTQLAEPTPPVESPARPPLPLLREPARTTLNPVPRRGTAPHAPTFRTRVQPAPPYPAEGYARAEPGPGAWPPPYPWYVPVGRVPPGMYDPYAGRPGF